MQPRRPHGHWAPFCLMTICPISPAPPRRSHGLWSSRLRRWLPRRGQHFALGVDDDGLDLCAPQIDAAALSHRADTPTLLGTFLVLWTRVSSQGPRTKLTISIV